MPKSPSRGAVETRTPGGPANLMVWQCPVRVVAGADALAQVGPAVTELGTSVLIVTDRGVAGTGFASELLARLALHGARSSVFDDVNGHPGVATVGRACAQARADRCRVVVGVGGGGPMDVAKVVSVALRNPELADDSAPLWNVPGGAVIPRPDALTGGVPLVQIPTTVGTGSEVNAVASLTTRHGKKLLVHQGLQAGLAIIDGRATSSLPRQLVREGSLEILSRIVVPYITDSTRKLLQDRLSEGLVRATLEAARRVLDHPDDTDARLALSLASVNSHIGWSSSGRASTGHVLWYLADSVGPHLQVRKMEAMAALLTAYLRRVVEGTSDSGGLAGSQRWARRWSNQGTPMRLTSHRR